MAASAVLAQDRAAEKEAALGAVMAQQFRERGGMLDIAEARAYLERVVGELAAAQPGDGECCTVELFARAEAEGKPAPYPGGYLFVPAKLFLTSADEEAFVRALAHAVAHVRQRDWIMASAANYVRGPVTFAGPVDDRADSLPKGMRAEFEGREARADEAAEEFAQAVKTGTGEFERLRDRAPLATPRPSLLR
jgi:hypothetical protein